MYIKVKKSILTDGSEAYDVVLGQGKSEIVLACTSEKDAVEIAVGVLNHALRTLEEVYVLPS